MTPAPSTPEAIAEEQRRGAAESVASFANRYHYSVTLRIEGRIRFLSHLEMVDTLLGAFRRSGVHIALSEGMRPKPRIKMAMPRPVATEAWSDIVEVELRDEVGIDEFSLSLSEVLPAGLTLHNIERLEGVYASAASRVAGATWRWTFDPASVDATELASAIDHVRAASEVIIERASPGKRTRTVDVRRFLGDIDTSMNDDAEVVVRAFIRLTSEGSAKPDEVIRVLAAHLSGELRPRRTVRESIAIAEPNSGGQIAEPELVGADVPDGPAKPWGAC
ncbi:MAG: TIGR03936 family radical SAM-associated protein [Gaiellales bacterium]